MRKSILTTATAAALVLLAAGCGSGSGSSSASDSKMPTVKIMVGGIDKQIYLPFKLADDLGFYKKYGVNVELSTEQDGGVGAEDAMASGQVDMAGAWYNHTIVYQSKGKGVETVVQLSGAPGEREMCGTESGVHSGADFKGKTMGVTDLGSGTDSLTQFLATKAGLKVADFHRQAVGAGSTAIAAIAHKTADCVMTTQPTVTALEKQKLAYSAVDLATTQGATQALGGAWPAAGAIARTDWVNAHKDAVQKVVDALVATLAWMNSHSAADIADKLPQSYVQNDVVSKGDYVTALTEDKGQFLPDGLMPAGGPKTVQQMEIQIGAVPKEVDLSKTFTNDFVTRALKDEGITPVTTPAGADG